ncbi:MAG: hypothetical protein LUE24_07005 [Lachnospiraceae bacterium]|nr:hypothetical protein [Lachnospiraceae bacterium]
MRNNDSSEKNMEAGQPKKRTTSPIFFIEVRDGVELAPDYDPGFLDEAIKDSHIRVLPMSGRLDKPGVRCPIYLTEEMPSSALSVNDELPIEFAPAVVDGKVMPDYTAMEVVETAGAVMQPAIYQQNAVITINSTPPAAVQDIVDDVNESVCNYAVTPQLKLVYLDRFGKEQADKESFVCSIRASGCGEGTLVLRTCEIKSVASLVGDKFSAASVNPDVKKVGKVIENRFRSQTAKVPTRYIYTDHGWQEIEGTMIYAHDCLPQTEDRRFETGMTLPFLDVPRDMAADVFYAAHSLYSDIGPISVMLSFSVMGVLYRPFDEAGYTPRFLLFINGKTGSMKTALAKILFTQLTDEAHRKTLRRVDLDSITSFERGIVSGHDTITVFDDYSPAKSARQKRDMEMKLESLVRMTGDGSTRSRSNVCLEDRRGEGVQGMVMLTGELTGKGLSSNLRCFYCGIQRDKVNEEAVSLFQENEHLFTTFIDQFARYVSAHWSEVVGFIRDSFQRQREMAGRVLKERRLIDSAATLCLASQLIRDFLIDRCGQDAETVSQYVGGMENAIREMAAISEAVSSEDTPIVRVMTIIDRLIQGKQVILHRGRPNEQQVEAVDGFTEGDFIYFHPDRLYAKIKSAFATADMYLPLDMNELARALCEEGVAIASSNGASKKTYYARILIGSNTRKMSFIKINMALLRRAIDTI